MKAEKTFSLKDQLFNEERVKYLSQLIGGAWPEFDQEGFRKEVVSKFPELELKQRIFWMRDCLETFLPKDYEKTVKILLKALPEELDPGKKDDDFGEFILAPMQYFVAKYGCTREHLQLSLRALREMTKRFSCEDGVRYFLNAFEKETLAFLLECTHDTHYHVRRWTSEGTRPKLPWSLRLEMDYRKAMPILDQVYGDETRYVTRSVANHLNDVAKIDAELVVATLKKWEKEGGQQKAELDRMKKHALRTLLKQADVKALGLLGYRADAEVAVVLLRGATKKVKLGEAFVFALEILSKKKQKLLLDYVMEFAGGGKKVFQLKQLSAQKKETITLEKKHLMRLMTTRRLHTGAHAIKVRINGKVVCEVGFELVE